MPRRPAPRTASSQGPPTNVVHQATRLLSLAAALAALSAHAAAQQPSLRRDTTLAGGPTRPVREPLPCRIVRVVDGDTIECSELGRVRLIGIDTPELSQEPYGAMAERALVALLDSTTAVALEPDVERRDRYGRMLAYVWVDSTMINWALVRLGWAVLLTYPPNVQYVDLFTEAQRLAREAGMGLWEVGGFECLPRDRRRGRC